MYRREFFVCAAAAAMYGCAPGVKDARAFRVWGRQGTVSGAFLRPRAIGCHAGEVYVIDTTGRIQVFDGQGVFQRQWSVPDATNGTPTAIHFGGDSTVYVPDTHCSRILEYDREGALLFQWGEYGSETGRFIYPTGLVRDADGVYFISEYGQGAERIQVFDPERKFMRAWGSHGGEPGQFNRCMAIDIGPGGNLYTADTANHRIQCFTREGELLRVIGGAGSKAGQLKYPHDLAIGPNGAIYAAEYGNHRISRFALNGASTGVYGAPGRGAGGFNGPRGVAVAADGTVYVADTDMHRVQAFQPVQT